MQRNVRPKPVKLKMSTQYGNIGTTYDEMRKLPVALLERANVEIAMARRRHSPRSRMRNRMLFQGFPKWGTTSVVGVYILISMYEAAQASTSNMKAEGMFFQVGDCSKPMQHEKALLACFWVVAVEICLQQHGFGDHILNIAMNIERCRAFCRYPLFVITPRPTEDPKANAEAALDIRSLSR